jgi:hypothetical protein
MSQKMRYGSETLDNTFLVVEKMFENYFTDMCAAQFLLVLMGAEQRV